MRISGETKVVGLFGYPISHTLSPLMQNVAFREAGVNFIYLPFSVKSGDLERATRAIPALGMVGINVTIPHKEKIIDYLDEVSPEVEKIGAVNTVVNRGGRLIGYNTDGEGFIESLRTKGLSLKGKEVLLLGAGGAALAISVFLLKEGINHLVLINRTYSRALKLIHRLKKIASSQVKLEVFEFKKRNSFPGREKIDLLINTTSLGMHQQDPTAVDVNCFSTSTYVYDIVYNRKTRLLEEAEKRGMSCQGGVDMLIHQGALSFKIWTGKEPPLEKMKKAVKEHLKKSYEHKNSLSYSR